MRSASHDSEKKSLTQSRQGREELLKGNKANPAALFGSPLIVDFSSASRPAQI
jgi:hypothetical protein